METPTIIEVDGADPRNQHPNRLRIGAAALLLLVAALISPRVVGAVSNSGVSLHVPAASAAAPSGAPTGLADDDEDDEDDEDEDEAHQAPVTQPTTADESGDAAIPGSPSFTG